MRRILSLKSVSIIGCIILLSCSSEKRNKIEYYQSKYDLVKHEDWATIQHASSFIENNVYGKDYLRNNHLIIFSDSNTTEFGWSWDYKFTSKRLSSAPHIVAGKKIWQNHTTIDELPAQIDSIETLNYNFNYQLNATGNIEQVIVLWFTNNIESNAQHVALQLTIILESIGIGNIGKHEGEIKFGDLTFDEYHIQHENTPYKSINLKLKNKTKDFNFEFIPYMKHFIENKHLTPNDYLACVEMGTFIKWGTGESVYKNYKCSLKLK